MSSSIRPVYLAWDERKISPGKPIMHRILAETGGLCGHLHGCLALDDEDIQLGLLSSYRQTPGCVGSSRIEEKEAEEVEDEGDDIHSLEEYQHQPSDMNAEALAWGSDEELLEDEGDNASRIDRSISRDLRHLDKVSVWVSFPCLQIDSACYILLL